MVDLQLPGSSPGQVPPHSGFGHATHTCVPLSLISAKRQLRSVARKITVGLESHWSSVTDLVVYPPTGSWPKEVS